MDPPVKPEDWEDESSKTFDLFRRCSLVPDLQRLVKDEALWVRSILDKPLKARTMLVTPVRRRPPYRLSLAKALLLNMCSVERLTWIKPFHFLSSRPTGGRAGIQSLFS
jgi:hypothetical protein